MSTGQGLLQITTWNVQSMSPSSMANFMPFDSPLRQEADIHVIGLQEAQSTDEANWQKALSQLGGDRSLDTRFSFGQSSVPTTRLYNGKGGVSINMNANGLPGFMSFTTAHLSAGQTEIISRIKDFEKIMMKTKFPNGLGIRDHQCAFFFGDLNFRVADTSSRTALDLIGKARETNDKSLLQRLFRNDQLSQVRGDNKSFEDFQEQDVSQFYPTYKLKPGSIDEYSEKRVPSWTDRILFREKDTSSRCRQVYYGSKPEVVASDHKPVVGIFRFDMPLWVN